MNFGIEVYLLSWWRVLLCETGKSNDCFIVTGIVSHALLGR